MMTCQNPNRHPQNSTCVPDDMSRTRVRCGILHPAFLPSSTVLMDQMLLGL